MFRDISISLSLLNACVMRRLHLFCLLFIFSLCLSFAQSVNYEQWMAELDDAKPVSSLSIPGAHDAATGEGLCSLPGFGVTQSLDLTELWECGVRAFDLRPAVKDTLLYIYHGKLRTKVSFAEALDVISAQLDRHPSEFAIVLLREESDSENEKEHSLWSPLVGGIIRDMGEKAAVFSPDMKLGDVRGKVLFLTRSSYSGAERGARITGWCHSKDGCTNARILPYANGSEARLQVQDYYAPTDAEKRGYKLDVVRRFFSLSTDAKENVWTINFLSGYSTTWLGCTSLATTSGYKRNAAWLHAEVLDCLEDKRQPLGIVFMDYAGVDKVCGGLLHWASFKVRGGELVNKIIDCNFVSAK